MKQTKIVKIKKRGSEVLLDPLINKGAAFTRDERAALGLNGLLPHHVSTMEEQIERRYANFKRQPDQLSKYVYLSMLQNRNETLFYNLVKRHVEEMLPLIYTPTVGDASLRYSEIYSQSRGVYFSYPMLEEGRMDEVVANIAAARPDGVDVIVVTDGERILGLGDLGAGGMAISVGKLALYTSFGGINPARAVPVVLDVGTNNEKLLADPLYIGLKEKRKTGEEYSRFVDAFVKAIKKKWPQVLLQWEDFGQANASPLLEKYRDQICSFNDDIQGTAAVVLAGLYAAVHGASGGLKNQRIVVLGAGSAGLGICNQLQYAMEQEGLSSEEAKKRFYLIDRNGLIHSGLEGVPSSRKAFAQEFNAVKEWKLSGKQAGMQVEKHTHISMLDVMKNACPTILIGVCAQPGAFEEEMIVEMAKHVERPVIFPLSNPITKCEAKPEDLLKWTDGRAIVAAGSPFPEVQHNGKSYKIGQCNNVYIFPGLGLGVIACKATTVSNSMFLKASQTLSLCAPRIKDNNPNGALFPTFRDLDDISRTIAIEVAMQAIKEGAAKPMTKQEVEAAVDAVIWRPDYPTYIAD